MTEIDTSTIGSAKYIVKLEDNFGNSVEEEIVVNVIENSKEKAAV